MTTTSLREGELVLALPDGVEGRQFDSADHRLSHCMKAVDWIIKRQDQLLFVEVKDPASGAAQRHTDVGKTLKAYQSGSLIPDLVAKFRDTFLYGWACEWTLARVSYQNTRTAVLKLGIVDESTGETVSYSWAEPGAERIGSTCAGCKPA